MTRIGIDIGGTNIKAVLVDDRLNLLSRTTLPSLASDGPSAVIEQVHRVIESLIHKSEPTVQCIGIGAPGSVDFARGLLLHPPNFPGWDEVPLVSLIEDRWSIPVGLENDANCAALGEAYFGAGKERNTFVALTLGTGVGSGIIIDRKIHHGEKGFGGEFGHMTIDYNGPACNCGNTGCIEAYIGSGYLMRRYLETIRHSPDAFHYERAAGAADTLSPRDISNAAEAGDKTARAFLYETGALLGVAIASTTNLLDITTTIIGGGVAAAGKPLFDGVLSSARTRVLRVHRDSMEIVPAALGNDAGMFGAAMLGR